MCQNKILHHSSKGFVTYCKSCKHIQMAFGTTAIRFSEVQFKNFCEYVFEFYPQYDKNCKLKNVWIPTTEHTVCFLISGKELHQLKDILEEAQDTLTVFKILNELNLNPN